MASRVAEHAPALLIYLDSDLRVRFANRHLHELLGHAPREIRGKLLAELLDPATLKYALKHKAEVERGNLAPRDYVLRDKSGERKFVQVRAALDRDDQGRGIGFFACTADNAAEREARAALERLSFALSASAAGVWYWDLAADSAHYSPEFKALLGYDSRELPADFTFFTALHPDEVLPAFDAVATAIQEGGGFDREFRMRCADGGYRWLRGVGRALRDPDSDAVVRFAGSVRDISPRKQAELQLREANQLAAATLDGCLEISEELAERRRLDRVRRELLAAANHGLRTPLASIIAALDLLRDGATAQGEPAVSSFVGIALENAERLARVVEQWLDVERIDLGASRIQRTSFDPGAVLAAALAGSAAFAAERGVRLEVESGGLASASGDAERLQQALAHLIQNAIERSPRGAAVRAQVTARKAGFAVLIEDQGAAAFSGLDLGLSLAKAIVERLGGVLRHGRREQGDGAAFHIEMPQAGRT
jgi:PAS domain S-box-containing protein